MRRSSVQLDMWLSGGAVLVVDADPRLAAMSPRGGSG
jgi:hypothetical protein